jgi:hypothetical protein
MKYPARQTWQITALLQLLQLPQVWHCPLTLK